MIFHVVECHFNKVIAAVILIIVLGAYADGYSAMNAASTIRTASLMIHKTSTSPRLDGKLDDICWQDGVEITPFILHDGSRLASQQTRAYVCYDDSNMYFAFECFDINLNPALNKLNEIKSLAKERDSLTIFNDDCVEVYLSPFDDAQKGYYHFAINRGGVLYDAFCANPASQKPQWNGEIETGVSSNDKSWIVEISVSYKSLGIDSPRQGDTMRLNLCREQQAYHEFSCWSPTFKTFHAPDRFGQITYGKGMPKITWSSIGGHFAGGENPISIKVQRQKENEIIVKTFFHYEKDKPAVWEKEYRLEPGKQNILSAKYLVPEDTSTDADSGFMSFDVVAKNGQVFYKSPEFLLEKKTNSPIITRFLTCTFGEYFNFIKSLYIPRNGVQYVEVAIQSSLREGLSTCSMILETPEFLSLVNPADTTKRLPKPQRVAQEKIRRNEMTYNRYTLTFGKENIYDMGKLPTKEYAPLVLEATGSNRPATSYIYYHTEISLGGQIVREPEKRLPLNLLPPLKNRTPRKVPIIDWSSPTTGLIVRLGAEEQKKIITGLRDAGFNYKGLNEFGNDSYSAEHIEMFRKLGLTPIKGLHLNNISPNQWMNLAFPDAVEYLREFPEYRATSGSGKKMPDVICLSHLLNKEGRYRAQWEKWLGETARNYAVLLWDNEIVPIGPDTICYCKKCLNSFREYKNIAQQVTPALIFSRYRNEWIDYKCHRNSQILDTVREIIKKANPSCQLWVYSGYQCQSTRDIYGANWAYIAPYIDRALCGYGRPISEIAETKRALGNVPLTLSELVWSFQGSSYPMEDIRINLFRRLIDGCGGGLMVYNDFSVDGRYYNAISDIAALVSDYEDFFIPFRRDDQLAKTTGGESVVLQNDHGERLVVIFNDTDVPRDIKVIQNNLPADIMALDGLTGKVFAAPQSQRLRIPAKDIRVVAILLKSRYQTTQKYLQ